MLVSSDDLLKVATNTVNDLVSRVNKTAFKGDFFQFSSVAHDEIYECLLGIVANEPTNTTKSTELSGGTV